MPSRPQYWARGDAVEIKQVRMLVVIDGSDASRRAVGYAARIVGGRRRFWIRLAQILPPCPPALLEFGGAGRPDTEAHLEALLATRRKRWIASAKQRTRPFLDRARGTLRKAGPVAGRLAAKHLDPFDGGDLVEDILREARAWRCRTIVVGRTSLTWLGGLLRGDLAEQLVGRSKGLTVWVVE